MLGTRVLWGDLGVGFWGFDEGEEVRSGWVFGFVWFGGRLERRFSVLNWLDGLFGGWCWGWGGGTVGLELAVFFEVEEGVAELAVEGVLVAAEEFEAVDVVVVGWEGGVFGVVFGGFLGCAGECLPGFDEVEVGVGGGDGGEILEVFAVEVGLGVEKGGFEGDEAGLTPAYGGELVDEDLFGVVRMLAASFSAMR